MCANRKWEQGYKLVRETKDYFCTFIFFIIVKGTKERTKDGVSIQSRGNRKQTKTSFSFSCQNLLITAPLRQVRDELY